jgi:hypothetical protein
MSDLLAAVVAVVGTLGGTSLGGYLSTRNEARKTVLAASIDQINRRRTLYTDFVTHAQGHLRFLRRSRAYWAAGAPDSPEAWAILEQDANSVQLLQAAHAAVSVGGSADAFAAANRAYMAMGEVADRMEQAITGRDKKSIGGPEMTRAIAAYADAILEFASVVRDELAREEGSLGESPSKS